VDSGVGIPEKKQRQLFQLDQTLSTPGTENEQGTGLGLHLCKEYMDHLFGKINIESHPGKGSRFTISLRRTCE
jgi:signal transduction histidine kinase